MPNKSIATPSDIKILCEIIHHHGEQYFSEISMTAKDLFELYSQSPLLLIDALAKGRENNFLEFDDDIFLMNFDDEVSVYLVKPIEQIRDIIDGRRNIETTNYFEPDISTKDCEVGCCIIL